MNREKTDKFVFIVSSISCALHDYFMLKLDGIYTS